MIKYYFNVLKRGGREKKMGEENGTKRRKRIKEKIDKESVHPFHLSNQIK